jgi:probable phosphoglycerate mutase
MVELREWNFGSWEGQPNADLWGPVFADLGFDYASSSSGWAEMAVNGFDSLIDTIHRHDPLGRAEDAAAVRTRVSAGLDVVLAAARGAAAAGTGDVLVVSHGAVLGTVLRMLVPGHAVEGGFPNCGIVSLRWEDGELAVAGVDHSCSEPEETVAPGRGGAGGGIR